MSLDPMGLFASLVWGAVGLAYLIYGKKQGRLVPSVGGVAILVTSYFVGAPLTMSLVNVLIMVATHLLAKRYD